MGLLLASAGALVSVTAGAATAASVDPIFKAGNVTCTDVMGPGFIELKVEPVADGTYSDGTLTVSVDEYDTASGEAFDFTANIPVQGVVVKGGPNANFYDYRPAGVLADTGLHAPVNADNGMYYGLSHISFCYKPFVPAGEITVDKTATGEWDRTVTWALDKKVDGQSSVSFSGEPGDSWTPTWEMDVTKTVVGPTNYHVYGDVKVVNSSNMTVTFDLADALDDGTIISLTCDGDYTLAPTEELNCEYDQAVADDSAESNTATVTPTATVPTGYTAFLGTPSDTADIQWSENLTGSDDALFEDPRLLISETLTDSKNYDVPETFTCPEEGSDAYVDNYYTETFVNTAYLTPTGETTMQDSASVTIVCQEHEGLTPGFWKQPQHLEYWAPTGYSPSQTLGSVFTGVPAANNTLLQALSYQGNNTITGAKQNLLRAGVAALLNASHPDVNYPLTTAEVIAQVNAGLASSDRGFVLSIKDQLDEYNNLGGVDLKWNQ